MLLLAVGLGLTGCVIFILLTVIQAVRGKSCASSLAGFALSVALLVGGGALFTMTSENAAPEKKTASAPVAAAADGGAASQGVVVDSGLFNVAVTVPAYLLPGGDEAGFDPAAYAQEAGFSKAEQNGDGSMTFTMSKERHGELLKELASRYDRSFAALAGAENTPYIQDVRRTDGFRQITVSVDRAGYEGAVLDLTPFTLGMSGMMYQTFAGEELSVEVTVEDAGTGGVLYTAVYPVPEGE